MEKLPTPGVGLSQDGLIELQATATYIIDQWGDPRWTLHGRGKWVTPQNIQKCVWKMGKMMKYGIFMGFWGYSIKACRFCCPLYNGVWKGWINHASLQKSNPNPLCNDCNGCSSVMFDIDFAPNLCYQKVMWEEVPPLFYDSPASLWYCSTGKVDPTVVNLPAISHCASQEISWTPPRPRHF